MCESDEYVDPVSEEIRKTIQDAEENLPQRKGLSAEDKAFILEKLPTLKSLAVEKRDSDYYSRAKRLLEYAI